ncbi:MAG: hypothetical protein C0608_12100 [Deltaproteobacteria bacterium]|nr:MAG: hypothetical protein C0608_12100 [Deltaproteobacteria bacterium]
MINRGKSRVSAIRVTALVVFFSTILLLLSAQAIAAEGGAGKVQSFDGHTFTNDEFSLDPYLGKVPILLDFGSIYCTTCVQSIPHLIVMQNKYGTDKLKVVGVNLDTYGLGRVKRFFNSFKENLNFPILIDRSLSISSAFDVLTLPTYILIDKNAEIVATIVGWDEDNKAKLEKIVDKVVSGEAISAEEKLVKSDVTILAPSNFTVTYQRAIWVVGLTGDNPGPFTVRLNGGTEYEVEVYEDEKFAARIPLSYGSNFIEVVYPKGADVGTQAVVLFRDPRMGEGMGVNFPEYAFHIESREEQCLDCHDIMPAEGEMGMTMVCDVCHGYQTKKKYVHGPIPVGGCPACHDFESAPKRFELTSMGSELCFTCHGDVMAQFERKNVHGPVAMGFCTVCHNPHSSSFKYQLNSSQTELCLSCHDGMNEKLSGLYVHAPVENDECTGCHDPHSSENDTYFLKGNGAGLCALCHSESLMASHTHPTGGKALKIYDGMLLDADGNYICKSCHNPHSSDSPRLSPVVGGCNGCHEKLIAVPTSEEEEEERAWYEE